MNSALDLGIEFYVAMDNNKWNGDSLETKGIMDYTRLSTYILSITIYVFCLII
jgi:hypothetical protein